MQKYVVLVKTTNTWCFSGRDFGHDEIYFVQAHDAEQAIMVIAHERDFQSHDHDEQFEAYEMAKVPRGRIQKRYKPKPNLTKTIGPNTLCMCAELKQKGLKGSCKVHKS